MNITIGKTVAVSERGGRRNNEDAIYPQPENVLQKDRLFLVCDGVGGAERGEVASALACESIRSYFDTYLTEDHPSEEFVQCAIRYAETQFDNYIETHPDAAGMATTLTLVYIGSKGVTMAHVGDSRIYYYRGQNTLYKTSDHSLVNSLVQMGRISEEEAATHPQRNVILRAIQGTKSPTEADVMLWTDVEAGDKIFMCTDGVLECFTNESLLESSYQSAIDMKDLLLERCTGNTKDNYSFYILPIQRVQTAHRLTQNIRSFFYSLV